MAMKYVSLIVLACSLAGGLSPGRAAAAPAEDEGPDPLSVTRWTEKTELFAEYPALVVGQTSRSRSTSPPWSRSRRSPKAPMEVQLRGADGQAESFSRERTVAARNLRR